MKHFVIIGATSLIAEHCARQWVTQSVRLTLVGRSATQLKRIADDLSIRSPASQVSFQILDFQDRDQIKRLVDQLFLAGTVDAVLIAHGSLPDQKSCEDDLAKVEEALLINGVSPLLIAEAFAQQMAIRNSGTIAVIGSVAGDRGRRSNYVYGAAKGMVDRYLQGMRHRFAGTQVRIITIKPGPTRTPMTAAMAQAPKGMAEPEQVAEDIVAGIANGKVIIYTPGKWRLIMLIIRHLPGFIFNRMNI